MMLVGWIGVQSWVYSRRLRAQSQTHNLYAYIAEEAAGASSRIREFYFNHRLQYLF